MGSLSYKGYHASVEFDADDAILIGRIAGINDVVGFHASDAAGLVPAFHEAVDNYLATCVLSASRPKRRTRAASWSASTPPGDFGVHARSALAAQLLGVSLNQFSEEAMAALTDQRLARAG